jgi:hypothetical protein
MGHYAIMKRTATVLTLSVFFLLTIAGTAQQWTVTPTKDVFKDTEFTRFRLEGKYLQAPNDGSATPALVLDCKAEPKRRTSGKIMNAFLVVGNSTVDAHARGVVLDYRLDGGKIHHSVQGHSTNYSAVALDSLVVSDFFYGHMFEHKPNTSPQIQKVVVSVPEYLGGDVVIQFDLGDVTEVAKTCGILLTK